MRGLEEIRQQLAHKSQKELVNLAQALSEVKRRDNSSRGELYVPNGACEDYIDMVGMNRTFVNLFAAANGVGKSAVGANLIRNICYGPANEWFDFELFANWPYLRKGRIIADTKTVQEKIVPELEKWFPDPSRYKRWKNSQSYYSKWVTDTGFEFDIMTYNQDPVEFESVELGFVWFDEPPPLSIYRATIGRGRRGMIVFLTLTPLKHSAWIKNDIVDEADKEEILGKEFRQKGYVTGEIEQNCKEHGTRGILNHIDIDKMLAEYPPDEYEARAKGKFGHLMGRVHKLFDRNIHVIKPFQLNQRDYSVYQFLDPHPRTPDAASWFALDRNDQIYQVAELYMTGSTKELAYQIKKTEKDLDMRIEGRFIDPSAYNEDKHNDFSLAADLAGYGLHYQPGSKDLDQGIRLTNEGLSYSAQNGKVIVPPRYYIFNTCERTIWEFENYIWDDWRGAEAMDRNPKAKPKDKDDHMMENLHRGFLADLRFRTMVKANSNTNIGEVESAKLDPYD